MKKTNPGLSAQTRPAPPGRTPGGRSPGGAGRRSRPRAGGARAPGPRARPLPWERTQLLRPMGRREGAQRPIRRETLSQDGDGQAAGCGVSAPRRGLCEAAPLPAPSPAAAPPLRLPRAAARPPRLAGTSRARSASARRAATSAGSPRASGSPRSRGRLTITRQ